MHKLKARYEIHKEGSERQAHHVRDHDFDQSQLLYYVVRQVGGR